MLLCGCGLWREIQPRMAVYSRFRMWISGKAVSFCPGLAYTVLALAKCENKVPRKLSLHGTWRSKRSFLWPRDCPTLKQESIGGASSFCRSCRMHYPLHNMPIGHSIPPFGISLTIIYSSHNNYSIILDINDIFYFLILFLT